MLRRLPGIFSLRFGLVLIAAWQAVSLVSGPFPALAAGAHIERVILSETGGRLKIDFRLAGAFEEAWVRRAVQAGLETRITYRLELVRVRPLLPARTLARRAVTRSLIFDPLRELYLVETGDPARAPAPTASLALAQHLMTEVSGLELAPMKLMDQERTYRIRLKAVIHGPRIPDQFRLIHLWGPLELGTGWHQVELRR